MQLRRFWLSSQFTEFLGKLLLSSEVYVLVAEEYHTALADFVYVCEESQYASSLYSCALQHVLIIARSLSNVSAFGALTKSIS